MITALYRLLDLLGRWRPTLPPQLFQRAFGPLLRVIDPFEATTDPFEATVRPSDGPARSTGSARPPRMRRRTHSARRGTHLRAVRSDAGMTTAEYAVGTVAAVAFAVVLFKVVQSPAVHSALAAVVTGALHVQM